MPKVPVLALTILLVAALPAQATKIHAASDPKADFSSFRTYAWRPPTGPDPTVGPEIRAAADDELADKGLRKVAADADPDLWIEFVVGSGDMLYADWMYEIGWCNTLWAVPGGRSRVAAGILMMVSANGHGKEEDQPVWGGRLVMEGNTPDALMVMAGRAGAETRKLMRRYPGTK